MNLGLIKSGVQLLTGFGAGMIADRAIAVFKPKNLVGLKKVAVKAGGIALSMMVVDKTSEYVGEAIDKTVEDLKKFIEPKEVTEEVVEETVEGVEAE